MDRNIITEKDLKNSIPDDTGQAAGGIGTPDGHDDVDTYKSRLFKYIPAEVIAAYLTVQGIIETAGANTKANLPVLLWVTTVFLLAATPFYLKRIQKVKKGQQIIISSLSFLVWVFFLGGPFKNLSWYDPIYGAILFPLFTFLIPIIEPE
jgi:hypothetical protein